MGTPVFGGAPFTGPLVGPTTIGGGSGRGGTVWQSYPWTRVVEGGNAGAQLAGLGGIDFNALLQWMKKLKEPKEQYKPNLRRFDPHALSMQRARDADELARMEALRNPPPTKMTYVGNSPGFLEMDPLAMNAYQRQAYLPQNASFYGPSGNEQSKALQDESRLWQDKQDLANRQKTAQWFLQSLSNPNVLPGLITDKKE